MSAFTHSSQFGAYEKFAILSTTLRPSEEVTP